MIGIWESWETLWCSCWDKCFLWRRPSVWTQPVGGPLRTRRLGQLICQSPGIRDTRPLVHFEVGGGGQGGTPGRRDWHGKCSHVKGIITEQSRGSSTHWHVIYRAAWRDYISLRRDTKRSPSFNNEEEYLSSPLKTTFSFKKPKRFLQSAHKSSM